MSDLASHYSRFRVSERLLLTGHSHQAWPDVGFEAQQRAWLDAAEYVDLKWEQAARQAQAVREGFARLLGDRPDRIALGQNTHELVVRWLSGLPLRTRPRLVTTDAEFHTIRRQLDRLAEEALPVLKVASHPIETLAERLADALDSRTAAVLVSSVLFETAEIVPNLAHLAARCEHVGVALLVDAYHHLNVVPFDVDAMGLRSAYVTGGGYKYCQLGEGNAFLRVPPDCALQPLLTGWFAEFEDVERTGPSAVVYGKGASAFAGATYDPVSHYRAAAVFNFHAEQGLTAHRLVDINRRQIARLKAGIERLDIDPRVATVVPMPDERRGGFLAIRTGNAPEIAQRLRGAGLLCDARGEILRLGPAPYLRDLQLEAAAAICGEVLRARP